MSNRPQALALPEPMGQVLPLVSPVLTFACSGVSVAPNATGVLVPARQAYSHSASVGRRIVTPSFFDISAHQLFASFQLVPSAGKLSPTFECDCAWRITFHCACVTSNFPM